MPITRPILVWINFVGGGTAGHSPADATTYTFGISSQIGPLTSDGVYFPMPTRPGVVRRARVQALVTGTLASAGSTTVRVRNATSTVEEEVSPSLAMTAVSNAVSNDAMSLPIAAGDAINIEFTTPTWATNPTAVFYNATIEVELY